MKIGVISIAKTNWTGVFLKHAGNSKDYPYSLREGLFGFLGGSNSVTNVGNTSSRPCGVACSDVTFRPVFYAE